MEKELTEEFFIIWFKVFFKVNFAQWNFNVVIKLKILVLFLMLLPQRIRY